MELFPYYRTRRAIFLRGGWPIFAVVLPAFNAVIWNISLLKMMAFLKFVPPVVRSECENLNKLYVFLFSCMCVFINLSVSGGGWGGCRRDLCETEDAAGFWRVWSLEKYYHCRRWRWSGIHISAIPLRILTFQIEYFRNNILSN